MTFKKKGQTNPNSLANLKPIKPGEYRGGGRPKGSLDFNNRMKHLLLDIIKKGKYKGKTGIDVWVEKIFQRGVCGNQRAAEWVIERLEPIVREAQERLGVNVAVQQNVAVGENMKIDFTPNRLAEITRILQESRIIDVNAVVTAPPAGALEHGKKGGNGNGKELPHG